jgi:LuxR family maltose regulon positive regulatory protein
MRIAAAVLRLDQHDPHAATPREPLSNAGLRALRYLPTPEIARELSVSTSTVKTHLRNLYVKLGAHSRAEAVGSARALGLLGPSARPPAPA